MGGSNPITEAINFVTDIVNVIVDVVVDTFQAVGNFISGIFSGFRPDVPSPASTGGDEGVLVTKAGTNLDIPVIYGFRRVGGRIIFAETNGDSNRYLYVIYVIAEGEIEGIKKIKIDDNDLPTPTDKYAFNQVLEPPSGEYKGRLQFQLFAGTESQSQSILANESASWGNEVRKLPGVAYAVMRFEWRKAETQEEADANPYRGGIPLPTFDVLGKKVYNVINHAGGLNLASDYSGLSKAYSYNPINCLLDYMMNPRYGAGMDKTEINADAFKTAAIKCNQQTYYDSGQTQEGKVMTLNAVYDTKQKVIDNVKNMLSGCRGFMPYIQGRYKVKIEDGGNATDITSAVAVSAFDVTEDHLLSEVALRGEQKQNKFNQVIVTYIDPNREFTEQQVSYTETADAVADGEELVGEFQFLTVSNESVAYDIARMIYKKSRNQRFISFSSTPEILEAEPGDIITVTSSILNLNAQEFRVVNMNITGDGLIDVTAREHNADVYPFVPSNQITIPAQSFLPSVYNVTLLTKPTRTVPLSVAPPNDPEPVIIGFDSAGAPITQAASTANDQLPASLDEVAQGNIVTKFASFGSSTSALVYNVTGYTFPIDAQIETTDTGGKLTFAYNPPQDQTIDVLRLYVWSIAKGSLVNRYDYSINYNLARPQSVVVPNISDDDFIVPRWVNTSNNSEYVDGSTGVYSAIAYTDYNLQATTGKDLLAAINSAIQAIDFVTDPTERITNHSLV